MRRGKGISGGQRGWRWRGVRENTQGGAWGGKSARQGAAQVVLGMRMAAGKKRASQAEDGLDAGGRPSAREQRPGHPQIDDAPVGRDKAFGNVPAPYPGLVNGGGLGRGNLAGSRGLAIEGRFGARSGRRLVKGRPGGLQQLRGWRAKPGRLWRTFTQGA
jgi:hypothetical protein